MFDEKMNEPEIEIKTHSKFKPLIGVLLVLISLAGYVFITRGISSDLEVIKVDISTKESEAVDLQGKIDAYKQAEENLDLSTEVERLEILKTVPTEMQQDEVIRDLVDIAETYDTNLHSLSFSKGDSGKEGVSVLRINASMEGNYTDLTRFLQGIEENARMLRVNSISVQISVLDVSEIKRATFTLSMEAFFQNE